jgi:hypothetical protein
LPLLSLSSVDGARRCASDLVDARRLEETGNDEVGARLTYSKDTRPCFSCHACCCVPVSSSASACRGGRAGRRGVAGGRRRAVRSADGG